MKKIILFITVVVLVIACSNDDVENNFEEDSKLPKTEIVLKINSDSIYENDLFIHEIKGHAIAE